jgi:colanic acid/amylovoran biosynthesis glycosyltransferase
MRLAVFTNRFPNRMSTFFARDMRGLINAGIDIDIFPFYPLEPELWECVPHVLNETILPRNKVHHINLMDSFRAALSTKRKLNGFFRDMAAVNLAAAKFGTTGLAKTTYVALKALAWAKRYKGDYDHILAYWGNYAATCAYMFNRLIDRPVPFSMFLHAGMDLYEGQVFLKEKLLYANNIFVVCDFNKVFLSQRYPDIFPEISSKIHKYHLGLDLSEFKYDLENRFRSKILAVGSLEKHKGFDYLLRAGQIISSRGLEFQIEIIGEGKEKISLERLATELKIENRVTFLGWLPSDEVRTAMTRATILVHPSSGLGDAVPTVIKEAMAVGTPVIASSIAGIPELLDEGRCGILVAPQDSKAIADAIEKLVTDKPVRLRYANTARRYAEETFDLWRNGQQLAGLLRATTRVNTKDQSRMRSLDPRRQNENSISATSD